MTAVQKRLKMALDRQKEAADKRSTQQQQQQKQAEGLVPRMKVTIFRWGRFPFNQKSRNILVMFSEYPETVEFPWMV